MKLPRKSSFRRKPKTNVADGTPLKTKKGGVEKNRSSNLTTGLMTTTTTTTTTKNQRTKDDKANTNTTVKMDTAGVNEPSLQATQTKVEEPQYSLPPAIQASKPLMAEEIMLTREQSSITAITDATTFVGDFTQLEDDDNNSSLPSAKQLARLLCTITLHDDDIFGPDRSLQTLEKLAHWMYRCCMASKSDESDSVFDKLEDDGDEDEEDVASIQFLHDFLDLGSVQILLWFLEEHLDESKVVIGVLSVIQALTLTTTTTTMMMTTMTTTTTMTNGSSDHARSQLQARLASMWIAKGGLDCQLRAFELHSFLLRALELRHKALMETKAQQPTLLERWWQLMRGVSPSTNTNQQQPKPQSRSTATELALESLVALTACGGIAGGQVEASRTTHVPNPMIEVELETTLTTLEALTQMVPYASPQEAAAVLEATCQAAPKLMSLPSSSSSSNGGGGSRQDKNDCGEVHLLLSLLRCIIASTAFPAVCDNDELMDARAVTTVTVNLMKAWIHHNDLIGAGCVVLSRCMSRLDKSTRKALGVIAVLGTVVASQDLSNQVKDMADRLLEDMTTRGIETQLVTYHHHSRGRPSGIKNSC